MLGVYLQLVRFVVAMGPVLNRALTICVPNGTIYISHHYFGPGPLVQSNAFMGNRVPFWMQISPKVTHLSLVGLYFRQRAIFISLSSSSEAAKTFLSRWPQLCVYTINTHTNTSMTNQSWANEDIIITTSTPTQYPTLKPLLYQWQNIWEAEVTVEKGSTITANIQLKQCQGARNNSQSHVHKLLLQPL